MQHKQRNTKNPKNSNRNNLNRRHKRAMHPYNGPKLKQHMNHNILNESQKFFVRALAHCYHEIEELLVLIAKTPYMHQKALRMKKAKLQREAEYILKNKLSGVEL